MMSNSEQDGDIRRTNEFAGNQADKTEASAEDNEYDPLWATLRHMPGLWLPAADDHEGWEKFALEAEAEALTLGVNVSDIVEKVTTRAPAPWDDVSSPRAARFALAMCLKRAREQSGLSWHDAESEVTGLTPKDIADLETGTAALFPLLLGREALFAAWGRRIGASRNYVIRLVRSCPFPPTWAGLEPGDNISYKPAGSVGDEEVSLPPKAFEIADRLSQAWEKAGEDKV
jgi:hypothetical protein